MPSHIFVFLLISTAAADDACPDVVVDDAATATFLMQTWMRVASKQGDVPADPKRNQDSDIDETRNCKKNKDASMDEDCRYDLLSGAYKKVLADGLNPETAWYKGQALISIITALIILVGWVTFVEGAVGIVLSIWQATRSNAPTTISFIAAHDKTESAEILEASVTHAPISPNSTLFELLFNKPEHSASLSDFTELLPRRKVRLAIAAATDAGRSWSYAQLKALMGRPEWDPLAVGGCVGTGLMAGPEGAAALLCILARTKCAPMNVETRQAEAAAALQGALAATILVSHGSAPGVQAAARELGLPVWSVPCSVQPGGLMADNDFIPTLVSRLHGVDGASSEQEAKVWNTAKDVALLLRTSGTTGKSKVVPLGLGQLISGARSIAASMGVHKDDVCLNAMPLFHIGGISCNLLGSLVSGGTVICLDRFEPQPFIKSLGRTTSSIPQPTWYYAVPSMHLALVNFSAGSSPEHHLRIVRSGAAALSPPLQQQLEALWCCPVFATYSMTECMPIASPLFKDFGDSGSPVPLGSVGRSIGPTVVIRNEEVMIKGDLVMRGYQGPDSGWTEDGIFPTGDLGHIDAAGFLWLVGRRKEVINRGGETIPPQEVEESLSKFQWIQEVAAFAIPHRSLGETVGLAVVVKNLQKSGSGDAELLEYAAAIQEKLERSRFPGIIAFLDLLPRTPAGKVQRLSIFAALQRAGGPAAAADEMQTTILDARKAEDNTLQCRYLLASPDTVASLFHDSSGKEGANDGTIIQIDSMGQVRMVTRRGEFEASVVQQLYILGCVGILLGHWGVHSDSLHLRPSTTWLSQFLYGNNWHMQIFFAGSAYLDQQEELGLKDFAMVLVFLLLPCIDLISMYANPPPHLGITTSQWGFDHPARWFFMVLIICRIGTVALRAMRVPKSMQVLLCVPLAYIWPILLIFLQSAQVGCNDGTIGGFWNIALRWVGVGGYTHDWVTKLAQSTVTYVFFLHVFPPVLGWLGRAGPKTRKSEIRLGVMLWLLFAVEGFCFAGAIEIELWQLDLNQTGFIPASLRGLNLQLPVMLPLTWFNIILGAACSAYLPITALPDIALRSFLFALLLIPLTVDPMVLKAVDSGMVTLSNPFGQMLVLFVFFAIYLVVAAPLFQASLGLLWNIAQAPRLLLIK